MQAWRSEQLRKAETDDARFAAELAELEAEWERLEGRADFRADLQREQLRPRLAAGLTEHTTRRRVTRVLQELELRVNQLLPIYFELDARVRRQVDAIKASAAVPDRDVIIGLLNMSRDLESLRGPLFDITQAPALARRFDAIEELRQHWHQQAEARERVFTHHLSRPHLPVPVPAPWAGDVGRLRALFSATTATINTTKD